MDYQAWENTTFGYHHDPAYRTGILMDNAAHQAQIPRAR